MRGRKNRYRWTFSIIKHLETWRRNLVNATKSEAPASHKYTLAVQVKPLTGPLNLESNNFFFFILYYMYIFSTDSALGVPKWLPPHPPAAPLSSISTLFALLRCLPLILVSKACYHIMFLPFHWNIWSSCSASTQETLHYAKLSCSA